MAKYDFITIKKNVILSFFSFFRKIKIHKNNFIMNITQKNFLNLIYLYIYNTLKI